jgi:hypothetical protein
MTAISKQEAILKLFFLSHFSFLYIQPGYAQMYRVGVSKKQCLKY